MSSVELSNAVTQFDLAKGFDLGEDAISAINVFPDARNEIDEAFLPDYWLEQKHTVVERHFDLLLPSDDKEIRFGLFVLSALH